jgi:putative phage-type endonuclease
MGFVRGPEWDATRLTGIGGSESAAAMGISPFKTRFQLWKEKRREVVPEDIGSLDHVYFGTMLEGIVVAEYRKRTGKNVRRVSKILRSRKFPWMLATLDFDVLGASVRIIGEAKTVGMFAYFAKEWGDDGSAIVPIEYYAQAQHNMVVARAEQCEIPVLIGGQQFKIYHVPRDEEFIGKMIFEERRFWESVASGEEPPPTTAEDLLLKFPGHEKGKIVEANRKTINAYNAWLRADKIAARQDKRCEANILKMKLFMGDAEILTFNGEKIATWRRDPEKKTQRFSPVRPKEKDDAPSEFVAPDPAAPKRRKIRPDGAADLGLATEVEIAPAPAMIPDGDGMES